MKNALILGGFFAFSICAYLISFDAFLGGTAIFWGAISLFAIILTLCFERTRIVFYRFRIIAFSVFVTLVITFVFNCFLGSLYDGIVYTLRIFAMTIISLDFCALFSLSRLKSAVKFLLPFESARISIDIAFALFPQLIQWSREFRLSLESKGAKLTARFVLRNSKIITNSYLTMLFSKLASLEISLRAKGV